MKPRFTISILAMSGLEMTRRCIESVLANSKGYELILTDNASDDGTADYFEELKTKAKVPIRVLHNKENKGFSEPNKHALTLAKGKYFVMLNNDATVPSRWLNFLEEPFKNLENVGITGPTGSCCSLQAPYPSFHGSIGPNYEYVEGSCLCIPTKLAREIELFADYLHFAYGEDVDLSLRVRARGLNIIQCPFSITHIRAATSRHIANIEEIQRNNHAALIDRWDNYLTYHRLDLPVVIKRKAAIGDVLLTTSLIAEIKRQQPSSEIYVETAYPEIFRNNPNVIEASDDCSKVYKWARIIDLNMSYENMPETNIVDAYFKKALIMGTPGLPELYPSELEIIAFNLFLADRGPWIAIHAGPTTWTGKNWPMDRWEKLCQWLLENNQRVMLVGTPGPSLPHQLDLRGKTNFQELAVVMRKCELFIGVDSFPMHVAQSQGCPVIGLFGATSPEYILQKPYTAICGTAPCAGERHRIAGATYTPCDGACMNSISVEQVIDALR